MYGCSSGDWNLSILIVFPNSALRMPILIYVSMFHPLITLSYSLPDTFSLYLPTILFSPSLLISFLIGISTPSDYGSVKDVDRVPTRSNPKSVNFQQRPRGLY